MSVELLGRAMYNDILKSIDNKKNVSIWFKKRPLNILECEESDIEYPDCVIEPPHILERTAPIEKVLLDDTCCQIELFMRDNKLIMTNGQPVGKYRPMIDDNVPQRFCNEDSIVLHPLKKVPMYEYILDAKFEPIHKMTTNMIYREYNYDIGLARFVKTGDVVLI